MHQIVQYLADTLIGCMVLATLQSSYAVAKAYVSGD